MFELILENLVEYEKYEEFPTQYLQTMLRLLILNLLITLGTTPFLLSIVENKGRVTLGVYTNDRLANF